MNHQNDSYTKPPEASSIQRHIQLYFFQYIGIALIFLIPILAAFGLFGESFTEIEEINDDLAVNVRYPTRYRYKMINTLTVSIQNTGDQSISLVNVDISRSYIDPFSTINFMPAVTRINGDDYEVELENLEPGDTRIIVIELQAESYGKHDGVISISNENVEITSFSVSTIILP